MLWLLLACHTPGGPVLGEAIVVPMRHAHHATVAWEAGQPVVAWTAGGRRSRVFASVVGADDVWPLAPDVVAAKPDLAVLPDGRLRVAFQTPSDGLWLTGRDTVPQALAPPAQVRGPASVDLAVASDGLVAVWYDADGLGDAWIRSRWTDTDETSVVASFDDTIRSAADAAGHPDGRVSVAYTEQWLDRPDTLVVDVLERGGRVARWRHAASAPELMPRRPTVDVATDGRQLVVFREIDDAPTSHGVWLVVLDRDARPIAGPRQILDGDRPVAAWLGDDAALVVVEVDGSDGSRIEATTLGTSDLEPRHAAIRVSLPEHDARRPHVAVRSDERGHHALISYETPADGGRVVVRGLRIP